MEVNFVNMDRERFMNLVGRCRGRVLLQLNDGGTLDVKQNASLIETLGLPTGNFRVRFDPLQDARTVLLSLIGFYR